MTQPLHDFPSTPEERRAELDAARACLLEEIERARREAAAPAGNDPQRPWSVAQIAYHLHLAERATGRGLQKVLGSGERVEPASSERLREEWERIRRVVPTREIRVQAPARVTPDNAPDLDRGLALLAESRQAFLQVLESAPEKDLLSIVLPHPFPAVGALTGVSWTSVTAYHELRHCAQIREMITRPRGAGDPAPSRP
jgi:hypothetical protein